MKELARNKDLVRTRLVHASTVPRLEGKVKNAKLRTKHGLKQIQKPKKLKKG